MDTMATPFKPQSAPPKDQAAVPLSDGARTVISLLLFVHMFALGLVFFANFEGGDWESELFARMKMVVRPYLYPLWLDRPYHYHLTYGQPLDFDHYLEVALQTPQSSEEAVVRIPDEDLGHGQRRERFEHLAWHFARRAEMQTPDELLPLTIGAGLIKQHDAARAQVRCFRKPPLFLDDVLAGTRRESPDERVYAADVFFLPGYDQPQLNKVGEARDVAPVIRSSVGGGQEAPARGDPKGNAKPEGKAAPIQSPPLQSPLRQSRDPTLPAPLPPALPPADK